MHTNIHAYTHARMHVCIDGKHVCVPYEYLHIDYCNRTDPHFQNDFCDQPLEQCVDTNLTAITLKNLRTAVASNTHWFVSVGYHKPHPPWPIPRNFTDQYPSGNSMPLATYKVLGPSAPPLAFYSARDLDSSQEFAGSNISIMPQQAVPNNLAAKLRRAYYGAVSMLDHNIGLLMHELDQLNCSTSTLLVLHGDHGW